MVKTLFIMAFFGLVASAVVLIKLLFYNPLVIIISSLIEWKFIATIMALSIVKVMLFPIAAISLIFLAVVIAGGLIAAFE